jgi:flagellar biosynthesis/type III secretory pathway protein FliH
MIFQTMNVEALARATTLLFGAAETEIVAKTYQAFAAAMQNAYETGRIDGVHAENDRAEGLIDEAFDEGFEQGARFTKLEMQLDAELAEADAEQSIDESFDDGYLEGVADARRIPAFADDRVQQIINDRADEAYEALEAIEDDTSYYTARDALDAEQVQDEA